MTTATMTDSELQLDVLNELKWEPSVDAAHIGVSVKDGVVTLSGHVSSYAEKYAAERAAKRVHGVKAVANELDVKLPGFSQRTDEDIATAAVNALKSHISVPADKIKVTVSNGWVKLEGEVEWQYQRISAENAVRYLQGVKGVSNLITVKPASRRRRSSPRSRTPSSAAPRWMPAASRSRWKGARSPCEAPCDPGPRRRRPGERPGRRRASTTSRTLSRSLLDVTWGWGLVQGPGSGSSCDPACPPSGGVTLPSIRGGAPSTKRFLSTRSKWLDFMARRQEIAIPGSEEPGVIPGLGEDRRLPGIFRASTIHRSTRSQESGSCVIDISGRSGGPWPRPWSLS